MTNSKHQSQPPSLLRLAKVIERVGFSRTSIYKMVAEGKFPQPISLGPRAIAWDSVAIDAWIAKRIKAGMRTAEERQIVYGRFKKQSQLRKESA